MGFCAKPQSGHDDDDPLLLLISTNRNGILRWTTRLSLVVFPARNSYVFYQFGPPPFFCALLCSDMFKKTELLLFSASWCSKREFSDLPRSGGVKHVRIFWGGGGR